MKASADFPYARLPGALRGFVRRASLWEGPDHLLSVTGTRFAEEYRRFYYRDIESIVVRKSGRAGSFGLWVVLGLACLICWLLKAPAARAIAGGLVLVLVARLILSLRYSCRCYIQTAVSREELPSLLRTWSAQKALERIRSRIAEVQGELPEEVGSIPEVALSAGAAATSEKTSARAVSIGINFAIAAFIFVLIDAATSFSFLNLPAREAAKVWFRLLNIFQVLGEGLCIVMALINIHRPRSLRSLRRMLTACLLLLGAEVWVTLYLRSFYLAESKALHSDTQFYSLLHPLVLICGSIAVVLGIGGLILVLLKRETYRRGDLSTS